MELDSMNMMARTAADHSLPRDLGLAQRQIGLDDIAAAELRRQLVYRTRGAWDAPLAIGSFR